MLHGPEANQSSGTSKTSLAVNGNSSVVGLSEVILYNIEELIDNVVRRSGSIDKEKVVVVDVLGSEVAAIILYLIQSDDSRDADILENVSILVGVMAVSMMRISGLDGTHECNKFTGNNPVEVAVLNSFVVLVFLHVEGAEIIPAKFDGILKTLKAMQQSAIVEAFTLRGITEMLEQVMVRTEFLVSLLGGHLENDNHERTHKEGTIDHLSTGLEGGAIMEDAVLSIVLVTQ